MSKITYEIRKRDIDRISRWLGQEFHWTVWYEAPKGWLLANGYARSSEQAMQKINKAAERLKAQAKERDYIVKGEL